ncbi:hypothetical protein Tco_0862906, partial [Tanacetum coccineum]
MAFILCCHSLSRACSRALFRSFSSLFTLLHLPLCAKALPTPYTLLLRRGVSVDGAWVTAEMDGWDLSPKLKNMNACSLCGSFDHNKRRCPKRFEDQEQVVIVREVFVKILLESFGKLSIRVEEKMTLKEVDGQAVEKIETKIISKDGTITRVPGKFQEDKDEVERNEVDSDLESTTSSKPVWEKTTKADCDRTSHHCPWCS